MQRLITSQFRYQPLTRDFRGLMELYELNYVHLRRLIPDIESIGERAVSAVSNGLDLHYVRIEKSRYTTTFFLSYCFAESGDEYWAPISDIFETIYTIFANII